MKVTFHINYKTSWGQRLFIVGSCKEAGADSLAAAKEMLCLDDGEWFLETQLPDGTTSIEYRYFVEDERGNNRIEEGGGFVHRATFDAKSDSAYFLYDHWQPEPPDKTFYTSAFTKNLFARKETRTNERFSKGNIIIRLFAPTATPEQTVAISGNQECLGNWRAEDAKQLSGKNFPEWEIRLDSDKVTFPLEYKFLVVKSDSNSLCYWEDGGNRAINCPDANRKSKIIASEFPFRTPGPPWKACGTAIPVFSLRSADSYGIGDIGDIRKLIDWAKKTGQRFIQLLPMNDTTRTHTWADSYPYSAISIYALHPLYIDIHKMGKLKSRGKMDFYERIRQKLNAKEEVDYPAVKTYKARYCRDFFKQEKNAILNDSGYKAFVAENRDWLEPYAAFSYLRDKNGTDDFSKWGEFSSYNPGKIAELCRPGSEAYDETSYIAFMQYTLHTQFKEVAEYARKNRVVLKGDIPIGVNRTSVEAWTEPEYFNRDGQAGAPPDDFSQTGQNWSFPTYNWDAMERDGLKWWKKRLDKLNDYFDCFRIDHILGFFRIWEIPRRYVDGLCGHFRPAMPLSKQEIESYGLKFDKQWTVPRINARFLGELSGKGKKNNLLEYHLNPTDAEHLTLKPFCSTQRKIRLLFESWKGGEAQSIKKTLMKIADETLFLEDPYEAAHYHPRISAQQSFAYRELSDDEKAAFDRLYHDFFYVRHNDFWKQTALKRLTPLVGSTRMLVCGEDLGMIPASVHEVMEKLQIFSLELERAPKAGGREFADLAHLPRRSVCTTSTHDMPPLRSWWNEDRARTQRYYNTTLRHDGAAPGECTPELAEEIITRHLKSASMLAIIPLQDWFAIDGAIRRPNAGAERINVPSDPGHRWRYRMHMTLEALLEADGFNKKIRNLISAAGR